MLSRKSISVKMYGHIYVYEYIHIWRGRETAGSRTRDLGDVLPRVCALDFDPRNPPHATTMKGAPERKSQIWKEVEQVLFQSVLF